MTTIQIITLDGQPTAWALSGEAIIAQHVPAHRLQHVQAKALYALDIQDGTRPGPYSDTDAERHAAALCAAARARRRRGPRHR